MLSWREQSGRTVSGKGYAVAELLRDGGAIDRGTALIAPTTVISAIRATTADAKAAVEARKRRIEALHA